MFLFIEREGILITRTGQISLRHDGHLRRVKHASPQPPAKLEDNDPNFWDVLFTDGTIAVFGRPTMRGALMRRLYESDCTEY